HAGCSGGGGGQGTSRPTPWKPPPEIALNERGTPMRPAKVMIVDDDRDLAESLAEMLELQGHTVQVASNGQEAVERHRKSEFDITFMDVRMPVMNGVDSFFAIRALR